MIMEFGMLWMDFSNTSLEKRILTAVSYYEKKYENNPDFCMINENEDEINPKIEGLKIIRAKYPHFGYFWIGNNGKRLED